MKNKEIRWLPVNTLRRKQLSGNMLLCNFLSVSGIVDIPAVRKQDAFFCTVGQNDIHHQCIIYDVKNYRMLGKDAVLGAVINSGYLAELLAFLDIANDGCERKYAVMEGVSPLQRGAFSNQLCANWQQLQSWFVMKYIFDEKNNDFSRFCCSIRQQEAYQLIRYLNNNCDNSEKIVSLSKEYGLSYSYFRRKTSNYLGDTAKVRMLSWRLAKTALDIIGTKDNITDIAMNNGFASSSHVCQALILSLGIKPSSLRKGHDNI